MSLILIDPGHGGSDPGAIVPQTAGALAGLKEKELNLEISLKLWRLLWEKGFLVSLTRMSDIDKSLAQRCEQANRLNAGFFISIHCNASTNPEAEGIEAFHFPGSGLGKSWAEKIINSLSALGRKIRGVKPADFYVLKHTRGPAVLVECGFLTNPQEANWLKKSTEQIAQSLCQGIESGFKEFFSSSSF